MGGKTVEKNVIYVGESDEYARDFGNGKKIVLKTGVVTPVSDEMNLILKDVRNVHPVVGNTYDVQGKMREKILKE